jgi:chorismate-pyruvate lyase
MNELRRRSPVLEALVDLFYDDTTPLGEFEEVAQGALPAPYGDLLDHHAHMTVTVERFHGCPVDVHVLDVHTTKTHYCRRIKLTRQSDGVVVLFGLVRLCLDFLEPPVRAEIESRTTPLGRVLIKHNVLREVQLISLWKVAAGEDLAQLFACEVGAVTYGRTALIYCNGVPAVELLEIVAPA